MSSLQAVVGKLESLFDLFNTELYAGELQRPVITVSPDDTGGALGWCTTYKAWKREGSDDDGFYEINLCAEYLARPFDAVCETLIHEMAHLYANEKNIKDTSRNGSYHNKKYKEIAEQHGLNVQQDSKYGWTITTLNGQTTALVANITDQTFELYRQKLVKVASTRKSSSKKYVCPDCGVIVRATKEVRIICADCDVELELEE